MCGSERIGYETAEKNKGRKKIKWLRYIGVGYIDVWSMGLSEHTKEEEEEDGRLLMTVDDHRYK